MLFVVTVYSIVTPEDPCPDRQGSFQIKLKLLGRALVPADNQEQHPQLDYIAAEGWEKIVGIARRSQMRKMGAPKNVINGTRAAAILQDACTSCSFTPAPTCFSVDDGTSHWIYDNNCECWLISIAQK